MKVVKISLNLQDKEKKVVKLSEKVEKRKSRKYKKYIDVLLLLGIVITSVNVTYITVPIFLTIVFILLQLKVYVDKKIKEE